MTGQNLISQNEASRKVPCDIYSRVVRYYQPIRFWNPGKREEFGERVTFDLGRTFKANEQEKK